MEWTYLYHSSHYRNIYRKSVYRDCITSKDRKVRFPDMFTGDLKTKPPLMITENHVVDTNCIQHYNSITLTLIHS